MLTTSAGKRAWLEPHLGHASGPCVARTRSATAICCSRVASAGEPTPPLASHVDCLNCRPPYFPLPVSACQSLPDSHSATASQSTLSAYATPVAGSTNDEIPTTMTAALANDLARLLGLNIPPKVTTYHL